jgi:hypothetical protein
MTMTTSIRTCLICAGLVFAGTDARAALVPTAGGLGVYDTVTNVTWTADGNLMATQAASYSGGATAFVDAIIAASGGVIRDTPNGFDPSGTYVLSANDFITSGVFAGTMDYWGARAWVNYLNATSYAGSNQWALPTTVDSDASGGFPDGATGNPAPSSSQLAQLFYGGLGQVANTSIASTHNGAFALFRNLQSYAHWSGTEYSTLPTNAWIFMTDYGSQSNGYTKANDLYVLAVSPGQVSAVPLPASAWLLGSSLLGLAGFARRRPATVVPA